MAVKKTDFVVVSDKRGGDSLREFVGIALEDSTGVGDRIFCQVNVTDSDNGFGWQTGVQIAELKDLGDGVFGA